MITPAVVISAFNRPAALNRLLNSLEKADYPQDTSIPLVISIDQDKNNQDVQRAAEEFSWSHGPKEILAHKQHLGLFQHFFACGDLSKTYGSIIFLEDDLLVSPVYYYYASQALTAYQQDNRIGGVSLYGLWFNGYTRQPFAPLPDGSDAFFLQLPYTQGEAFTCSQWSCFEEWRASVDNNFVPNRPIHEDWFKFRPDEWFPIFTKYLIDSDRYFVYPRISLSTGCGDAGTHFNRAVTFFQAALQRSKLDYRFKRLDDSLCVYDSFFEILPDRLNRLNERLSTYSYDVDLYATKSSRNLQAEYTLTSRRCYEPIISFGKEMLPIEANVVENNPGHEIFFCRKEDLRWDWISELAAARSNYEFFERTAKPSRIKRALFALWRFYENLARPH
ncbi:MAG: hypothetical protein P4L50_02800 [Anaerolineaceae bacterium]|nr:hypothetical protein [Anaerolineaceae bacterium]